MKKCSCGGNMEEKVDETVDGVQYKYFLCKKCGEEILDMRQLHAVADIYRKMKIHHAKLSQWGQSLGLRIPKQLVEKYNFKPDEEVSIIPEKGGIKIVHK